MPTTPADEVILVHSERVDIRRETVVTGTTTVAVDTHDRTVLVDEILSDRSAQIERVACDRFVTEMPQVREDGDVTIVPVVEERLVIEKRLFLREEIHIRRTSAERHHRESVVLREQVVSTCSRADGNVPSIQS